MADSPHPFFAPQGGSMRSAAPTSGSVDLVEPGRLCRELLARGSLDQRDDQGPTMTAEALLDGHYREHVSALFDRHAADFEPLLLGSLQYETPAQLERALLAFVASTGASDGVLSSTACLDLGCGTGLAGALLRKHCTGHLFGCDLSSSMIRIAESKGVYDAVPTCGDCVAYLRDQKASSADLIVAADVICYLHGLAELFSAAAAALASGGVFAFSTETCRLDEVRGGLPPQGPGWLEMKSERVAHCVEYVHYLVAQHSTELTLFSLEETAVRTDAGHEIRGNIVVLVRL